MLLNNLIRLCIKYAYVLEHIFAHKVDRYHWYVYLHDTTIKLWNEIGTTTPRVRAWYTPTQKLCHSSHGRYRNSIQPQHHTNPLHNYLNFESRTYRTLFIMTSRNIAKLANTFEPNNVTTYVQTLLTGSALLWNTSVILHLYERTNSHPHPK